MQGWRRALGLALAGALSVAAFGLPETLAGAVPPKVSLLWLLPLLSLGVLFHAVDGVAGSGSPADGPGERRAALRRALFAGGCWGLGFFLAGVSWVAVSMARFGGLPVAVAALATLVFCAFLALYPALACAAYALLRAPRTFARPARDALLFAALWALSEWLRGTLFTGFPWLAQGYAQMPPSPLAGYASVLGVYGVGFVGVWIAATLTRLLVPAPHDAGTAHRRSRRVLPGACAVLAVLAGGALLRAMPWTQPAGAPLPVRIVQGNIGQSLKWQPGMAAHSRDTYLRLLADHPPQGDTPTLTVLPETAIPLLFAQLPPSLLRDLAAAGDTVLGSALETAPGVYANGAVALRPDGSVLGAYLKRHLVPFGEYSPRGFGWFFSLLALPMADFTPGPARQAPLAVAGQRVAVNICYEDLFGEALLPGIAQAGVLLNLSNTAWFGDSLAQPQHLQIARLRALETGRPMLRATNSGISAVIAPDGEVLAQLPSFRSAVLHSKVQGTSGLTPYAKWGNWLILTLCAALIVGALWRRRRVGRGS